MEVDVFAHGVKHRVFCKSIPNTEVAVRKSIVGTLKAGEAFLVVCEATGGLRASARTGSGHDQPGQQRPAAGARQCSHEAHRRSAEFFENTAERAEFKDFRLPQGASENEQ